jgi:hypothetical protein
MRHLIPVQAIALPSTPGSISLIHMPLYPLFSIMVPVTMNKDWVNMVTPETDQDHQTKIFALYRSQ